MCKASLVSVLRNNADHYMTVEGEAGLVHLLTNAADALEDLEKKYATEYELRVKALNRLCGWCGVCSEEHRNAVGCDDIAMLDDVIIPHWIPVSDRLPDGGTVVLAAFDDGEVCSLWQNWKGWAEDGEKGVLVYSDFSDEGVEYFKTVTHWMPLPDPPKEGEKCCKEAEP